MFKKKEPKFAKVKPMEEPDDDEDDEDEEVPASRKSTKQMIEEEIEDEVEEAPVKLKKQKAEARIVSAEVLENGIFRTIILSNKNVGLVGETFELE